MKYNLKPTYNFKMDILIDGNTEQLLKEALLKLCHQYGLNNQKENLRMCLSRSDNSFNADKSKYGKSSEYKGVCFIKDRHKYRATIAIKSKNIVLGHFVNEKDAAIAYNEKALELFGEFAYLNIIRKEAF